jgi:hypothetical protein
MGTVGAMADLSVQNEKKIKDELNKAWKTAMTDLIDPTSDMSEDEIKQYEAKIMAKLKAGKHLTAEEMNYLQLHNPAMYRTALRVQLEKQRIKEELKHCKSKEEANNIIAGAVSSISDKDSDKEYLVAGIMETAKNFRKDAHYARLPETIEQGKKKKDRSYDFDDDEDGKEYSPIIEVLETLPEFDVMQ